MSKDTKAYETNKILFRIYYILKYKHRIIEICKIYLGLFKLYTTINITI